MVSSLNFNGLRCAVLGGGGFIGLNLCQALVEAGATVRAMGRSRQPLVVIQDLQWVSGDLRDPLAVLRAVQGCDVVFHLVTGSSPAASNKAPIKDLEINALGTLNLLDICRQQNIKKVIFISSGGTVYGVPQQLPIIESSATNPICAYGISKLAVEKYLALYHHLYGLDYLILRVSNPYGRFQYLKPEKKQGVVATFLKKALAGEPLEIWGNGDIVRDYIYVGDVIEALIKSIDYDGKKRIFNIGSGVGKSINEIIQSIEILLDKTVEKHYKPGRSADVPVNILDISMAVHEMQFNPTVDWMTGLQKTMDWLRSSSLAAVCPGYDSAIF